MSVTQHLKVDPRLEDPDGFYQELIDGHRDLTEAQSHSMNAQLVLMLANHIGDRAVLSEALRIARNNARAFITDSEDGA